MTKIVIFGNSGAGKSTLAKALSDSQGLAHFDLDTVAWLPVNPPQRKALEASAREIDAFTQRYENWVIEGCYADLIEWVLPAASEIIFLDLPIQTCIENARQRPWEPHKYPSKEAQDANLAMLLDWIADYDTRDDDFSRQAHARIYQDFSGKKTRYRNNQQYD